MVDQVGLGDRHHSEMGVASLERSLPPDRGTCCSASSVAGPRDCYERSPVPSEASKKKGQKG